MRRKATIGLLSFSALISTAGLLWAASPLKPIMRGWKADRVELDRMVAYNSAFSAPDAQRILAGFAADAQSLSDRIKGGSASAKDLRARFGAFSQQSAALAGLASRDTLKARYATWRGACKDCHDLYAN